MTSPRRLWTSWTRRPRTTDWSRPSFVPPPWSIGPRRLQLEKDTDDASGIAFTLGINHCLPMGTGLPTVVGPSDILDSSCGQEAVSLEVGAATGVNKPTNYAVSSGTWTIQNASSDRAAAHQSQIDLTFSSPDGVSYVARGVVSLPQLLF